MFSRPPIFQTLSFSILLSPLLHRGGECDMLLAAKRFVVNSCLVAVPCVWLFARGSISHMLCGCNADMRRLSARGCGSRKRKNSSLFMVHCRLFGFVCAQRGLCVGFSVGVCACLGLYILGVCVADLFMFFFFL